MSTIFEGFNTRADFENQFVTQLNRCASHAPWGGYASEKEALAGKEAGNRLSLDGTWQFCLLGSPDEVPEEFWNAALPYEPITVPGCWELQGHSAPVYTNFLLPFPDSEDKHYLVNPGASRGFGQDSRLVPPFIPHKNNVGLYVRKVNLPAERMGKRIYIEFEGVENAFYLFVNGQKVGYSQDSKVPASFDVTEMLHAGENILALAVLRFSDGIYMEAQDYLHLSGITRHVNLYFKNEVHIEDFHVRAAPTGSGEGELYVHVKVNQAEGFADRTVNLKLYNSKGKLVLDQSQYIDSLSVIHGKNMGGKVTRRPEAQTASFLLRLEHPLLWDTDHPNLYRAVFTLLSPEGEYEDVEAVNVGFRRVGIEDGVIKLNGKRLVVRGVARHEHSFEGGRTVTRERMIQEIVLMKRLNFNAVRTSHYPDCPEWYDLCDEYGILVVCEANMESQCVQGNLTANPDWACAMLERAQRMALCYKNHPCIFSWSLGNESGCGPNHAGMAGWLRGYDPTRLVQYEGNDRDKTFSDIRGTMYAPIEMIGDMVNDLNDRRPIVLIEYNHQIANAGGGAAKFKYLTEKYPLFQGGFVWDWQDKVAPARTPEGKIYPGYGGDFGEDFVDPCVPLYMCCNGMVTCDLRPKPSALEVMQAQSSVDVTLVNAGSGVICVQNRSESLNDSEFTVEYSICERGKELFRGTAEPIEETDQIKLAAAISKTKQWNITPWPTFPKEGDRYYRMDLSAVKGTDASVYLNVRIRLKEARPWCEAGFEMTLRQFALKEEPTYVLPRPGTGTVPAESESAVTLRSGEAEFVFDKAAHEVLLYRGGRLYARGAEPCLFRARTGLMLGARWGSPVQEDYLSLLPEKRKHTPISCRVSGCTILWEDEYENEKGVFTLSRAFTALPGGGLRVDCVLTVPSACRHIPRAGLEFIAEPGFENLSWYGRGPGESYPDRKLSAPMGLYEAAVSDTHFPFVPVSHCGLHVDTRSLTLSDGEGHKIRVEGAPFGFTAHHNSESDYFHALHDHELVRRKETYLAVTPFEAGIGGDMCWSTDVNENDMLHAGEYRFGFVLNLE